MNIVLDKSYLYGCKSEDICENFFQHKILLTESLFYETINDKPEIRASLFRKLPTAPTYCEIIPEIVKLLTYEIKNNKPSGKPSNHITKRDYSALALYSSPEWVPSTSQLESLRAHRLYLKEFFGDFLAILKQLFPHKHNITKHIEELKSGKIKDPDYINNFISNQRKAGVIFPLSDILTPTWLYYRYAQVHLLCAFDICNRYENFSIIEKSTKTQTKIMHDIHDMSYLALGLAEGGLATQEKKLIEWWDLLAEPGSIIISKSVN